MTMNRKGFIGSSDIPVICGLSPYKDAFALYLEKRGEIDPPEMELKVQRRGRILEPAVAKLYAAEHGAVLAADGAARPVVAAGESWRSAQVDAWEIDGDRCIPIEIKTASEFTRGKWGASGTDDAPTYYCAQLHWQMQHFDAPRGKIVALVGADDLRVYPIERDPKIDEFLLRNAREFWQRVQEGDPPPVNFEHPSVGDTLARLFKNPRATEILQATDELRSWRDVMAQSTALAKRYDDARDIARAHLLHAMGNAAIIDFGDGQIFERKEVKRKGYVVADTSYIDGRLKKAKEPKAGAVFPALPEEIPA